MRTRTALIFENPLKMTKVIERAGLKWPPDVPLHCYSEKNAEAECRADLRGAGSFAIMGKFIIRSSKNSQKRWVFQEYLGLQNSIHVRFNPYHLGQISSPSNSSKPTGIPKEEHYQLVFQVSYEDQVRRFSPFQQSIRSPSGLPS